MTGSAITVKQGHGTILSPNSEKTDHGIEEGVIIPYAQIHELLKPQDYSISLYVDEETKKPTGELKIAYNWKNKAALDAGGQFPGCSNLLQILSYIKREYYLILGVGFLNF